MPWKASFGRYVSASAALVTNLFPDPTDIDAISFGSTISTVTSRWRLTMRPMPATECARSRPAPTYEKGRTVEFSITVPQSTSAWRSTELHRVITALERIRAREPTNAGARTRAPFSIMAPGADHTPGLISFPAGQV